MGLSSSVLNLVLSLYKDQYFEKFNSVIELGSQHLSANGDDVAFVINNLTQKNEIKEGDIKIAKNVYKSIGFSIYKCIDPDRRHDALNFDLNEDIEKQGFNEQFDLVTNFGTSEHCFNQYHCFMNIHNLCKEGGIMVHGLPFQGGLNEGFFNYQPNFFFCLASANGYKILGIYINYDGFAGDLTPYSDKVMDFMKLPSSAKPTTSLLVSLQKTTKDSFRPPWNGKYIGTCEFEKYKFQKTTEYFLPVPTKQLSTWNHFNAIIKKIRQIGLLNSITRFIFWKRKN